MLFPGGHQGWNNINGKGKGDIVFNNPSTRRRRRLAGLVVGAALVALVVPTTAQAGPGANACERRNNNQYNKLLECVTLAGVREHQAALQAIATANGGTRADQTPGYEASVDYVEKTMLAAGWDVERVPFQYVAETDAGLEQRTPVVGDYATGGFLGSGGGDVTAAVVAVDINLVPPRANTSGCDGAFTEAAVGAPLVADPGGPNDFAGFPAGCDRPHPAGRVQLCPQGLQRPGRRRCRRDHLQPGRHTRPRAAVHRQRRRAQRGRARAP